MSLNPPPRPPRRHRRRRRLPEACRRLAALQHRAPRPAVGSELRPARVAEAPGADVAPGLAVCSALGGRAVNCSTTYFHLSRRQ